jgi:hypothetical protein
MHDQGENADAANDDAVHSEFGNAQPADQFVDWLEAVHATSSVAVCCETESASPITLAKTIHACFRCRKGTSTTSSSDSQSEIVVVSEIGERL